MQIFDFEDTSVRVVDRDGEQWWVAKDVCNAIGLTNPSEATSRLDDDQRDGISLTDSIGRSQAATVINESGLFELIFRSDKPEAKRFRKFVTAEVLPNLRKRGRYDLAQVDPEIEDRLDSDPGVRAMRELIEARRRHLLLEREQRQLQIKVVKVEQAALEAKATADEALHVANASMDAISNRSGWYSAMGWSRLHGWSIPLPHLAGLGRKATKLCQQEGIEVDQVHDPRFGVVNIYPESVLEKMEDDFRSRSA